MAKQTINIGSAANDGTGSTLRAAFDITNDNFTELYGGTGGLFHKIEGANFTGSLLVGHSTTGTLSSALGNTGIGIAALDGLTSGDYNVAVGNEAGANITTGSQNILIGRQAGLSLTTGSNNVAVGHGSLKTEDTHGKNVAIGYETLKNQDAGADAYNVAMGYQAGVAMTTGINNTLIGGSSGDALTTGSYNVALGYEALSTEDTGTRSIAIGYYALRNQNYDGEALNISIGHLAGLNISTGIQNTLIGGLAGDALTTGSNNIIIGYNAAASAVDVSNEVTIGNSSVANVRIPADSTLKIGASGDLQLEHLSSNSFIKNTAVGDLYIENQVDDKDIIFRSDDGSGGVTTYLTLDGSLTQMWADKDLQFSDNIKAKFGASSDLQILHDSNHSYIKNYTGDLYIENFADDKDIIFKSDDGAGGVETYFYLDGSSNGTNPLTVFPDNSSLGFGSANADTYLSHNGTDFMLDNYTGNVTFRQNTNDGDIIFQSDDGSGGVTEYFKLDGSSADGTYTYTKWGDNDVVTFGDGVDLRIYHNGTNSNIENFTGTLQIIQNLDDGDISFKCDDGSGNTATYMFLDGSNTRVQFNKDARFVDNAKVLVGTSDDLQIYHDGSNSYIDDASGTGSLYVNTNAFRLVSANKGENMIRAFEDGQVILSHNNIDRLTTTSTGVSVTGDINLGDSSYLYIGASNDLQLIHDGTDSYVSNTQNEGDLIIQNNGNDKDILFKCDDGSGGLATYFQLDGGITSILAYKDLLMAVDGTGGTIKLGASQDLQIQHNGTDSQITNTTGHLQFTNTADDKDITFASDNGSGGDTVYLTLDGGDVSTILHTVKVLMPNLPTSDPSVAGQLYTDSGVLKVSAG